MGYGLFPAPGWGRGYGVRAGCRGRGWRGLLGCRQQILGRERRVCILSWRWILTGMPHGGPGIPALCGHGQAPCEVGLAFKVFKASPKPALRHVALETC